MKNNIEELNATLAFVQDESSAAYAEWADYGQHVQVLRQNMNAIGATRNLVEQIEEFEGLLSQAFERWKRAQQMEDLMLDHIKLVKENSIEE